MKTLKWIFLLGYLSMYSYPALAQSDEVQALLDSSKYERRNKVKADSLAKLAFQMSVENGDIDGQIKVLTFMGSLYEYHYMPDSAYVTYEKALNLSIQSKSQKQECKLYINMAWIKHDFGEQDAAIGLIENSIEHSESLKDTNLICEGYSILGAMYSNIGNHEKSMENYLHTLELAEQINHDKHIINSSQGIGIISNKQKDFQKAELYFNKAFEKAISTKDTSRMINLINDFGILNKNKENYPESEKWYQKMLEIGSTPKFAWALAYAYSNLATLYYEMQEFQKGIDFGQKAVSYWSAEDNKMNTSDALNSLANNQLGLNKNQEAIKNLELSLSYAKTTQSLEHERDALLALSKAYEQSNQHQKALKFFKEHKVLYDKIYDSNKSEQIHELEQKYQSEKKDKEITMLANKADLAKVKSTRLWIVLGLTCFFSSLLFWFQIQKRRKEKLVEQQKQKVIELENTKLTQELDFKKQELASKVLQLCRKNEFLQALDKKVTELKFQLKGTEKNEVDKLSRQINRDMEIDDDWEQFLRSFESVHPAFNTTVSQKYPNFSKGEFRMACLLKMNLTTKDIANLLNITIAGVKKTRNRMRKKMEIDSSVDLTNYFLSINN